MQDSTPRSALWLSSASLGLGVAAILVATLGPSCQAQQCATDPRNPNQPTADIACPAGEVCYLGRCALSCNAGSERQATQTCDADSDCSDPALPFCVNRFCSGCETGNVCVPQLNICAPVLDQRSDGGQSQPTGRVPTANSPLDGGQVDGSVFDRDLGTRVDVALPTSHRAVIDVVQAERARTGDRVARIDVSALDLGGVRETRSATIAFQASDSGSYECDVRTRVRYDPQPRLADLGPIRLDDTSGESGFAGDVSYTASAMGGGYTVDPMVPAELLVLSEGDPTRRYSAIQVFGRGNMAIPLGGFPPSGSAEFPVPYRLVPGANDPLGIDTGAQLRAGYTVARPADRLVFLWENNRDHGVRERVRVRIQGQTHDLVCSAEPDSERIDVFGRLLETFRDANGFSAGTERTLSFERVVDTRLDTTVDRMAGVNVDVALNIIHAYESVIRFD